MIIMETKKLIIILFVLLIFVFVILPVIIVSGLIIFGLFLQVASSPSSESLSEMTLKTSWKTMEPIAITDWNRTGNTLTLVIKNNSAETLSLVSFTAEGLTSEVLDELTPGQSKNIQINGLSDCVLDSRFRILKNDLKFSYSTSSASNMTENGVSDIAGSC